MLTNIITTYTSPHPIAQRNHRLSQHPKTTTNTTSPHPPAALTHHCPAGSQHNTHTTYRTTTPSKSPRSNHLQHQRPQPRRPHIHTRVSTTFRHCFAHPRPKSTPVRHPT